MAKKKISLASSSDKAFATALAAMAMANPVPPVEAQAEENNVMVDATGETDQVTPVAETETVEVTETEVVETPIEEVGELVQLSGEEVLGSDAPIVDGSETQTETSNETPADDVADTDANPEGLVVTYLQTGAREHGTKMKNGDYRWVINPVFKGRERWFDRTKIHGYGKDDKGHFVVTTRKEVAQREMSSFIVGPYNPADAVEAEQEVNS